MSQTEARCKLQAAGLPYPRTCPVCRLGPCHYKETRIFKNSDIEVTGRLNEWNDRRDDGEYVGLVIKPHNGERETLVKISIDDAKNILQTLDDLLK